MPGEIKQASVTFRVSASMQAAGKVYTSLPADHPFYGKVGRVASEWAHLEHALDRTIWQFTSLDPALISCITAQIMGVGPRCRAIIALAKRFDVPEVTARAYRQLVNDAYVVGELRNRIVHDPWYVEVGPGVPGQFKASPYSDQRYGYVDVTEEEVDDAVRKIIALRKRAENLGFEMHHERQERRKTPDE